MSLTNDATMAPKAAPMMRPTAMSTTFPRMTNSLNSFSMFSSHNQVYGATVASALRVTETAAGKRTSSRSLAKDAVCEDV